MHKPDNTPGYLYLFFGVAFPTFVILFELITRWCASEFFDPMPTLLHTILVFSAPAGNFLVWYAGRNENFRANRKLLGAVAGLGLIVSLYYTVLFLPMLPFAAIAVIAMGLGLLPYGPVSALVAGARGYAYLRDWASERRWLIPGALLGMVLGVTGFVVLDLPSGITKVLMGAAETGNPRERKTAVKWLRILGDQDTMLRACFGARSMVGDPLTLALTRIAPVSSEQARSLFYEVTGFPFSAVPPPRISSQQRNLVNPEDFDFDQGGAQVAARIRGLNLHSSRMDASVNGDAALMYMEWTLEFKNDTPRAQEARAQIALPPGGVVSRLTLWINDQEQEAAFGPRATVREAYTKVVRRSRDPVLVTTSGPDRVLLQCFPVPARGGIMKTRVGITAPLALDAPEKGLVVLPAFVERNFTIDKKMDHLVWIDSKSPLTTGVQTLRSYSADGTHTVKGEVHDAPSPQLVGAVVTRNPAALVAAAKDTIAEDGTTVIQRIESLPGSRAGRFIFVVDGSGQMRGSAAEIADAITALVSEPCELILAGDEPASVQGSARQVADAIKAFKYEGGRDNGPALQAGLLKAAPDAPLIWMHGTQPIRMGAHASFEQLSERRPGSVHLYDMAIVPGVNRLLSGLDLLPLDSITRLGSVKEDLARVVRAWNPSTTVPKFVREKSDAAPESDAVEGSPHLVRLWAFDRVKRLCSSGKKADTAEAVETALRYKLVTPVSGAVVLETKQQYQEAGLTPAERREAPAIPEPETVVLAIVAVIVLLGASWLRRRRMSVEAPGCM